MSNMIRMIYVSTTTNPVEKERSGVQVDIGRILMQARRNNPRLQVGGVLYFRNNYFFQCLEGDQQAVNEVFQKITKDPRHNNVQTVSAKRITSRLFSNWSMKYVAKEDSVTQLLQENGYSEFTPYVFDDVMLEKMLNLFVGSKDPTGKADQKYSNSTGKASKPGILSRMFGLQRTA